MEPRPARSVFRLASGSLVVAVEDEQPAGSCATGMREIEPGTSEYDVWERRLRRDETRRPRLADAWSADRPAH